MKKEHMEIVNKVLSDVVGYEVKPYLVNSSVRSGQNRLRYYWTNIPFENNLEDWGIKLKDILEPIPFNAEYPNYLKLPIVRKKGVKMLGNVLSLFDGISGGQVALDRLGIKYENYYASEIDKYAIQITQKNYPKTIQIGDVTKVKASDLPKIDLLMGGSPCQGFSIANQNRKNLVFNEYGCGS